MHIMVTQNYYYFFFIEPLLMFGASMKHYATGTPTSCTVERREEREEAWAFVDSHNPSGSVESIVVPRFLRLELL